MSYVWWLILFLLAGVAEAHDLESAAAFYSDTSRRTQIFSIFGDYDTRSIIRGSGRSSSFRLGYTGRFTTLTEHDDLLAEQIGDSDQVREHSLQGSYDQGIRVGTQVGVFAGTTQSSLGQGRWYGLRGGQWFLRETVQLTLEARKTTSTQAPLNYTDTDGKRIRTPEDLEGLNAQGGVTAFVSPTTILRTTLSYTQRSDRPDAKGLSAEVRQYVAYTRSAIHAGGSYYENVGTIRPVTTYGGIVAKSVYGEWHQRILDRMIITGGYRYYLEDETPRALDAPKKSLGSDWAYGSLRYRFIDGPWTQDSPEVFAFGGRYVTSQENSEAHLIGVGGRLIL